MVIYWTARSVPSVVLPPQQHSVCLLMNSCGNFTTFTTGMQLGVTCECVHLVMHIQYRSRDNGGGHTAVVETTHTHTNQLKAANRSLYLRVAPSGNFACKTKLPCKVHQQRMHAFSYTWSLLVTWQKWWSHHSIRHICKLTHETGWMDGWTDGQTDADGRTDGSRT